MGYTLLSRFQGLLCGSLMGEMLGGDHCLNHPPRMQSPIYSQLRLTLLQDLLVLKDVRSCLLPEEVNPSLSYHIILLALPIILYYHESPNLLSEKLRQVGESWHLEELVLQDLLLWGKGIALGLREKLKPEFFLSQLLDFSPQTPSSLELKIVQETWQKSHSLQQLIEQLLQEKGQKDILESLAIYCFVSTPEDFSLSLKLASQCPTPHLTASLTGALAGVYNGIRGIPLAWRLAAKKHPLFKDTLQGAKVMFNHWVGLSEPDKMDIAPSIACHNAGIIQPRLSLKIISQFSLENEKT